MAVAEPLKSLGWTSELTFTIPQIVAWTLLKNMINGERPKGPMKRGGFHPGVDQQIIHPALTSFPAMLTNRVYVAPSYCGYTSIAR